MAILITGGNGKIGTKLLETLSEKRDLLCFSRNKPQLEVPYVKGNFYSFEDLSKLDAYSIDTVVHLAAIQGGHSEEETLDVNITGTRKLFRYLIDRGCKRFITASSIAAVGCLDRNFVPLQLPIPDEHPCLAIDAYGTSKAMVEELTKYFHRQSPETEFINFRLGAVVESDEQWEHHQAENVSSMLFPFASLSLILMQDVINVIIKATERQYHYGTHTYNVVGLSACWKGAVADKLEGLISNQLGKPDISYYRKKENETAAIFSMSKIKTELGFVPSR